MEGLFHARPATRLQGLRAACCTAATSNSPSSASMGTTARAGMPELRQLRTEQRCHRWTDSCRQSGVIHHLPARCDPLNQRIVQIDQGALLRRTSQIRCCAPPSLGSHSRRGARYAARGLLWLISTGRPSSACAVMSTQTRLPDQSR